ncbi:hypothetical protein JMJ77_0010954 [Colletotrichum scovillei]|uniref:Uncharacterized protein n=1 Tax=Colletotrichum scovillei TaxID=1209932 RepID=A0A9P7UAU0_9PEZI|nr:hypothetical protein JMJ77_0010954 [Colletotrichum scovillei]KAG7059919.1 hypothetical protein JMJ78_0015204 [Colletotrichum scovillei]KAG7067372.1 hypothetical protein JMJ76_0008811 [Colletotrichum scovillei]
MKDDLRLCYATPGLTAAKFVLWLNSVPGSIPAASDAFGSGKIVYSQGILDSPR